MSHHSWNLQCYIFIWYKIWLLFCLFVGIDVLYIWFHINSLLEQHLLIHFCLHAFPTFISGKMENMLLIRSFFTLESWNTESNPLWRLPKKKQWVFFSFWTKQLQNSDGREGWEKWGRALLIKFAYYVEEWAGAEAWVRWKTLQLLIHPSTCSLSCVCFKVNSSCVRPSLKHTSIPLIYAHNWRIWFTEM